MSARFAELAFSPTPIGELSLRRRRDPATGADVHEVKLGEDYLMSSQFTAAEIALADLALARLPAGPLSVVVGGLGLGYTAAAALADDRVRDLVVIDYLQPVIDWHRAGLVPLGAQLTADPRCRLVQGDFFALSAGDGFGTGPLDAVLVDIDHSPQHLLDGASEGFYSSAGTARLAEHLRPGGVYALWSNDPPDPSYVQVLETVFADVAAEVVTFPNPLQDRTATNTVYLATRPG